MLALVYNGVGQNLGLNDRGHSVRSNIYLSSPKQTIELTYKQPLLKNPLNYYYEYSAGFENENKK